MGIIKRIKRRLPIVGSGPKFRDPPQPAAAAPRPPAPFTPPAPTSLRGDRPVGEFLADYVKENAIVLFMKGSPASPMCGFSARAAGILTGTGFAHFDVLSDPDVREGVKRFSDWPTIPQVYVGGEFVGGSDIVAQMHESGELRELIDAALAADAAPSADATPG